MTLDNAFKNLISPKVWELLPDKFRKKNKQYRSKYDSGYKVTPATKKRMLKEAKYTHTPENWQPPITLVQRASAKAVGELAESLNSNCAVCGKPLYSHKKTCVPV